MQITKAIIEAAILGFEMKKRHIDEAIAELRAQRNGSGPAARPEETAPAVARPRRTMSAAARKRIADAQRKRWAEYHAKHKAKN